MSSYEVGCIYEQQGSRMYIWGASGLWMFAPNKTSLLFIIIIYEQLGSRMYI